MSATLPAGRPIVAFESLTKHFAPRRSIGALLRRERVRPPVTVSLDAVSASVYPGELFGVLGPNGAGKSTLFRILATYLLPDAGQATIAGHDVAREPRAVRAVLASVLANERAINWRLSARENLAVHAALYDVPRTESAARVDAALARLEIAAHADRPVGVLSSGLRQRVLLARALVVQPRVLLLDEPTRSLDPLSAGAFRDLVRRLVVEELGCTVIVATHDSDEAFDWCDRVAVLHAGRVLAVDTADALAQRFGDALVGVWTTAPADPSFDALCRAGLAFEARLDADAATGDWQCVRLRMPNGPAAAAAALSFLHRQGLPVARFERLDRSLADLLERVVLAHAPGGN